MYKLEELNTKKTEDLTEIAKKLKIKKINKLNKNDLIYAILDFQAENVKTSKKEEDKVSKKDNKNIKISNKNNDKKNLVNDTENNNELKKKTTKFTCIN